MEKNDNRPKAEAVQKYVRLLKKKVETNPSKILVVFSYDTIKKGSFLSWVWMYVLIYGAN